MRNKPWAAVSTKNSKADASSFSLTRRLRLPGWKTTPLLGRAMHRAHCHKLSEQLCVRHTYTEREPRNPVEWNNFHLIGGRLHPSTPEQLCVFRLSLDGGGDRALHVSPRGTDRGLHRAYPNWINIKRGRLRSSQTWLHSRVFESLKSCMI